MHWRNEAEWQTWEERTIDGDRFTLTHLRSFDMRVVRPAKGPWPEFNAPVRVAFDCHVVTAKADLYIEGDSRYWKDAGGNARIFDLKRYKYSRILPEMIVGLANGQTRCYVAQNNNYMVWRPADADDSDEAHYQAYFDIYRPTNQRDGVERLILYVQSAFLRDKPTEEQREEVKPFVQICAELYGIVQEKRKGQSNKKKKEKKEARRQAKRNA
jgi:hypothetical protein